MVNATLMYMITGTIFIMLDKIGIEYMYDV
jgi:hypothetical protein